MQTINKNSLYERKVSRERQRIKENKIQIRKMEVIEQELIER